MRIAVSRRYPDVTFRPDPPRRRGRSRDGADWEPPHFVLAPFIWEQIAAFGSACATFRTWDDRYCRPWKRPADRENPGVAGQRASRLMPKLAADWEPVYFIRYSGGLTATRERPMRKVWRPYRPLGGSVGPYT